MQDKAYSRGIDFMLLIYAIGLLVAAYVIAPMHDYALYFRHWDLILSGGDPWARIDARNAYGPVYNIFALPYGLHPQLPKLIFAGCWLALSWYSIRELFANSTASSRQKWLFTAFWLINPFFVVCTAFYGFNDSLVALLCFIGVLVAMKGQARKSLVILTIGVLTKLYPAFLLPYLNKDWKDVRRNILIFIAIVFVAYLITYLIWGGSFAIAFGKANGRNPTLFSVMMFLHGDYFPFESVAKVLISLNAVLALAAVYFVFMRFQQGRIDQHSAFLAGFTGLLMFYKAGQQQFYLAYFAVFAAWMLIEFKKDKPDTKTFYGVLVLGLWFMLMAGIVYPLTLMEGDYLWVRHTVGLPTFIMLAFVFKSLVFDNDKKALGTLAS